MSIRRVTCPGCNATLNVPAAMTNVKCSACGTVWNVNDPSSAKVKKPAAAVEPAAESAKDDDNNTVLMVTTLVGGGVLLLAFMGVGLVILNRTPPPSETASAEVEETIKPREPQPYRVINKPEETRRRIYADYRKVARTTVETPLILPQGTRARASLENTLQLTYDRELTRFAALHDISVEDVQEVIKEGDAKVWDDSPRSNAVRDGKRVYSKEMSEGWERNPNRK